MQSVNIGQSNWQASNVALGTMRMATLTPAQAADALNAALEAGINFIDSADIYGNGASEVNFGKALKLAGIKRDQLFIQSKGGIVLDPQRSHGDLVFGQRYDFSKQHLLDAVDGILQRMGVDYLDAFLLHRPDPLMELDEVAAAFDELETSGKVRHFGVSNFNPRQIEMLKTAVDQPSSIQLGAHRDDRLWDAHQHARPGLHQPRRRHYRIRPANQDDLTNLVTIPVRAV